MTRVSITSGSVLAVYYYINCNFSLLSYGLCYSEILVEFSEKCYWVSEDGPGEHICINIVAGTVGPDGLVINVADTTGGSATGKCCVFV